MARKNVCLILYADQRTSLSFWETLTIKYNFVSPEKYVVVTARKYTRERHRTERSRYT